MLGRLCAHRASQFFVGMSAPTSGTSMGTDEIGAALSWGPRAAPILYLFGSQQRQQFARTGPLQSAILFSRWLVERN